MDAILEIDVADDLLMSLQTLMSLNHEVSEHFKNQANHPPQAAAMGPPPPAECRAQVAPVELPSKLTKRPRKPVSSPFSEHPKIGILLTTKEKDLEKPTS
jgi:hypothetical protein